MGNNEDLSKLFQNKLKEAEMDVREGLWDDLQCELSQLEMHKVDRKQAFILPYRKWIAAAASIIVILGLASVTRWLLAPPESQDNILHGPNWSDGSLISDRVVADKPLPDVNYLPDISYHSKTLNKGVQSMNPVWISDATDTGDNQDSEDEVVHVTIQITEQIYGPANRGKKGYAKASNSHEFLNEETNEDQLTTHTNNSEESTNSWKLMTGSAFPHGGDYVPVTVGASVERSLTNKISLETGLQFNHYFGDQVEDINSISIPLKANMILASSSKVDIYAMAGVAAEKTLEHNFSDDPVRFSVMGGMGVNYKIKDHLALFAEPTVGHHFNNDGVVNDLHGNRALQLGLTCGLRMSY